jgi:predicted Rossmann fold flavoprotein
VNDTQHCDVIVLGGGAAGLFCAAETARRGRRTIVVERGDAVGRKILISGGGRCNFTNLGAGPEHYLSENPHFCRSALARFAPADFVARVEAHGIAWHEKAQGQLFCDGSARQIVQMLVADATAAGARIEVGCDVGAVDRTDRFRVRTSRGAFEAPALVVASGGLTVPTLGASGVGYRIAERFGLPRVPTRPGLVPLLYRAADRARFGALSGLATPAVVTCRDARFHDSVLLTHAGVSGPAVLQTSSYYRPGDVVAIDLGAGRDVLADLKQARQAGSKVLVATALAAFLPRRLAQTLAGFGADERPLAEQPDSALRAVADAVSGWRLDPEGTAGYDKAEVTCGGVSTAALSSKTMEATEVPGLHFIGEVVDVTGWLGGYNFQWAWASAYACAEAIAPAPAAA